MGDFLCLNALGFSCVCMTQRCMNHCPTLQAVSLRDWCFGIFPSAPHHSAPVLTFLLQTRLFPSIIQPRSTYLPDRQPFVLFILLLNHMATPNFPPLPSYEQSSMDEDPLLFSEAPWMRGEYVTVAHLLLPYIGDYRHIPGGVTERTLGRYEWRHRLAIPRSGLTAPMRLGSVGSWLRGRRYRREPRRQWICHLIEKISLLQGHQILQELGLDLWPAHTATEA